MVNKHTNYLFKPYNFKGYDRVTLYLDNNNRKNYFIHVLVALTFIPGQEGKSTVNHKDHNTTNNNVFNLEWSTMQEQSVHRIQNTQTIKRRIRQLTNDRTLIKVWDSITYLQKNGYPNISSYLNNVMKHKDDIFDLCHVLIHDKRVVWIYYQVKFSCPHI